MMLEKHLDKKDPKLDETCIFSFGNFIITFIVSQVPPVDAGAILLHGPPHIRGVVLDAELSPMMLHVQRFGFIAHRQTAGHHIQLRQQFAVNRLRSKIVVVISRVRICFFISATMKAILQHSRDRKQPENTPETSISKPIYRG